MEVAEYLGDDVTISLRLRDPDLTLVDSTHSDRLQYKRDHPVSTADSGVYTCGSIVTDANDKQLGSGNSTMVLTVLPKGK